jgi:hypothetical protein
MGLWVYLFGSMGLWARVNKHIDSYRTTGVQSTRVTTVAEFTLKHPEFDPFGVVDHLLESTRHQSLVGRYVAFRL